MSQTTTNPQTLVANLQTAKEKLAEMKANLAALKEQEKKIKEDEKAMKEQEKAEALKAEASMLTDKETEVVINLRFTNSKLFKGSKYRTVEDSELVKKVTAFYMAELKKASQPAS
jgi:sRNA-binding protein